MFLMLLLTVEVQNTICNSLTTMFTMGKFLQNLMIQTPVQTIGRQNLELLYKESFHVDHSHTPISLSETI